MKHEDYQQWLSLSLYGELDEREERLLEEHLAECRQCRDEEAELRRMLDTLQSGLPEPSPQLLEEARAQLRGALRAHVLPRRNSPKSWVTRIGFPMALAASLVLGLVIGRVLLPSNPSTPDSNFILGPDTLLANVHFLDTDAGDGELEVEFDAVQRVHLRAAPSDPRIQFVLLQALRAADNPGIRIRAVSSVEKEFSRQPSPAFKQALIQALLQDENVGVRRRALEVLQKMPRDADIQKALLQVLIRDTNAGLRVAAIGALESAASQSLPLDLQLREQLQERLEQENNDFIRLRSRALLEEVRFQ